jgi:hypothetical protein
MHKRRNTEKQFRSSKCGTPIGFKNIDTYSTSGVDIWVKNWGNEFDMRGFEWIVGGKINIEKEYTA